MLRIASNFSRGSSSIDSRSCCPANRSTALVLCPILVHDRWFRLATAVLRADQEQAIEGVREWYAKHGRLPSRPEWEKAARGRPTTRTIERRWGWDTLMAKASGRRPAGLRQAALRERRRHLLLRLRAARDELGHWPASREWDRAGGDKLTSRSYARIFGSWGAGGPAQATSGYFNCLGGP